MYLFIVLSILPIYLSAPSEEKKFPCPKDDSIYRLICTVSQETDVQKLRKQYEKLAPKSKHASLLISHRMFHLVENKYTVATLRNNIPTDGHSSAFYWDMFYKLGGDDYRKKTWGKHWEDLRTYPEYYDVTILFRLAEIQPENLELIFRFVHESTWTTYVGDFIDPLLLFISKYPPAFIKALKTTTPQVRKTIIEFIDAEDVPQDDCAKASAAFKPNQHRIYTKIRKKVYAGEASIPISCILPPAKKKSSDNKDTNQKQK